MEAVEINIGVSNRHVHLTKEIYDLLFDDEMKKERELNQTGEFVSDKTVTLMTEKNKKENVKVLGPLRNYNQIEISHKDALSFGINPPVRASGQVEDSECITLKTNKGKIKIQGCIIAQRHIHMNNEDAKKYNLRDKQKVRVNIEGPKSGLIDFYIKVSNDGVMEAHIDTDDANAFILNNGDKGTLIL